MNQRLRRLIPITFLAVSSGLLPLHSQTSYPAGASGSPNSTVLVELFTSEGCSSCPPADALLRQINGARTDAGQLIVGISEHVTYWNKQGWTDPYSSEIYTARQNAYGNRFRLDGVYTPQIVIDGSEQIVGSDGKALVRAIQHEKGKPQMALHIVSAAISGRVLNLSFSAGGTPGGQKVEIMAVLVDDFDQSNVGRGENSGRMLAHVSVARSIARIATVHGSVEKTIQLPLPTSFDSGKGGGHHLILFAQKAGLGPVLGADSKPI